MYSLPQSSLCECLRSGYFSHTFLQDRYGGSVVLFYWFISNVTASVVFPVFRTFSVQIFPGIPIRDFVGLCHLFSVALKSSHISAKTSNFSDGTPGIHLRHWPTNSWVTLSTLYPYLSINPRRSRVSFHDIIWITSQCRGFGYLIPKVSLLNMCSPLSYHGHGKSGYYSGRHYSVPRSLIQS